MQIGSSAPSGSLASRIGPPSKRPASQAAVIKVDEARGSKQARLEYSGTIRQPSSSAPSHFDVLGSTMQSGRSSARSSNSSRTGKGARGRFTQPSRSGSSRNKGPSLPILSEPLQDETYHKGKIAGLNEPAGGLPSDWRKNAKSALANFMTNKVGHAPKYEKEIGLLNGRKMTR